MKILTKVFLDNVVTYKHAELNLNKQGVTQIRGNNKDSKTISGDIDVNAVGKSLLLRPIPETIFSSTPLTKNLKAKAKRDLFTHPDSSYGFSVLIDGVENTFVKKATKSGYDYKIFTGKDKEDTEARTKAYAEKKIFDAMGYSEEEFYSIIFVDSRYVSNLRIGTAAQRIEYFTNLFRLQDYDYARKVFNTVLSEVKKDAITLVEVEAQIKELNESLVGVDIDKLKYKIGKLKSDNKGVLDKFSKLNSKSAELNSYLNSIDNVKEFKSLVDKHNWDTENLKALDKFINAELAKYESNQKLLSKWDSYKRDLASFTKKQTNLTDKLAKLDKASSSEIKEKLAECKSCIKEFENFELPEFDNAEYKELKERNLRAPDFYLAEKQKLKSKLEINQEILQGLKSIHGESCPTCMTKLSSKSVDKMKSDYKKEIILLEKSISQAQSTLQRAQKLEKLSEAKGNYDKALAKKKELKKKAQEAQPQFKKLQKELDKAYAYEDCKSQLKNLEKPEKPSKEAQKTISSKDYKDYLKASSLIPLQTFYTVLVSESKNNLKAKLEKCKSKLKDLESVIESYSENLSLLTTALSSAEKSIAKLEPLTKRQEKLKSNLSDLPVIEGIIGAYSNKGIKLLVIRYIAAMVEKNLNQYAPLLYSEPTKFSFQVKDDYNFDICIERKINGKKILSDIRSLSGAEGRAFSLLLPLAILPLIPQERRLNIMVLDEPLANMSEPRKELFINSFVPKLNSVVPHVIIISTDNENYPNSEVYTITKNKGISTLAKT